MGGQEGNDVSETLRESMILKAYEEGSAACRNYSRLTQQVRVVTIVTIAAAMAKMAINAEPSDEPSNQLFNEKSIGVALLAFSGVLALVAWHYQSAFTSIRNRLLEIELTSGVLGPWCAHKVTRGKLSDLLSTYAPFIVLGLLGWSTAGWWDMAQWTRWTLVVLFPLGAIIWALIKDGDYTGRVVVTRLKHGPHCDARPAAIVDWTEKHTVDWKDLKSIFSWVKAKFSSKQELS